MYNRDFLENIDAAIIKIVCTSTGGGDNIASRDAGNLQQYLSLCVGAQVMLTENLWNLDSGQPRGLVNGAIGTVVGMVTMVWKDGTASHNASDLRKKAPTGTAYLAIRTIAA
ncbi:hypothetical protein E4U60_007072 [Claviceps pazoutovae]|uniref:DNA helicase Pif1-like 2B domain-containing protein n=1 Tax=Claviceps pazoutovae TaxID=1649127 RepID=A0A9P7MFY7_9HYPO|nr:hypothetical protein E4U60_007072 [Claviceps pazoutovae]